MRYGERWGRHDNVAFKAVQFGISPLLESAVGADWGHGNMSLVSHGAVATLYLCHLKGRLIAKKEGPPGRNGSAYYCFEVETRTLVQDWKLVDE